MSLTLLNDGWKCFGNGRMWRCQAPYFLLELDSQGNCPDYLNLPSTTSSIRKIKSFYTGRIAYGQLNANGNGLDILIANSLAESYGTVPTPFSIQELLSVCQNASNSGSAIAADQIAAVVDYILIRKKFLIRKEPGYTDPINTPSKISVGAHHCLISTALNLTGVAVFNKSSEAYCTAVRNILIRMAASSIFAAELAIKYFNNTYSKHQNEPPLLAAIYNAGSLRPAPANTWNLVQYGNHLDRWTTFYNTSRKLNLQGVAVNSTLSNNSNISLIS